MFGPNRGLCAVYVRRVVRKREKCAFPSALVDLRPYTTRVCAERKTTVDVPRRVCKYPSDGPESRIRRTDGRESRIRQTGGRTEVSDLTGRHWPRRRVSFSLLPVVRKRTGFACKRMGKTGLFSVRFGSCFGHGKNGLCCWS